MSIALLAWSVIGSRRAARFDPVTDPLAPRPAARSNWARILGDWIFVALALIGCLVAILTH